MIKLYSPININDSYEERNGFRGNEVLGNSYSNRILFYIRKRSRNFFLEETFEDLQVNAPRLEIKSSCFPFTWTGKDGCSVETN